MTNSTVSLWLGCVSGSMQTARQIEVLSTSALFLVDLETLEGETSFVIEMTFKKANREVVLVLFAFSGARVLQSSEALAFSSACSLSPPISCWKVKGLGWL